jgi:Raf kinase inhibitor-like YbhB/YbcL family protein
MPRQKGLDVSVEAGYFTDDEVCEGTRYSPQIVIGNLRSPFLAVILDELEVPQGTMVHWLLWNVEKSEAIPRNLPKQEEIERPIRGRQGRNSFGDVGYTAPCPPQGTKRRFRFRVFGVGEELELAGGSTGRDLERALEGSIMQYGEAFLTYERPMNGNILGRAP